jgi:hypothetical protein
MSLVAKPDPPGRNSAVRSLSNIPGFDLCRDPRRLTHEPASPKVKRICEQSQLLVRRTAGRPYTRFEESRAILPKPPYRLELLVWLCNGGEFLDVGAAEPRD